MFDAGYPSAVLEMGEVQAAARTLGLEVAPLEIRRAEDIAPAFAALKAQADALYVVEDALIDANHTRIITLALSARLPTICGTRNYVQAGALMSYGPNSRTCSGAPPRWSIRFCAEPSLAIFRSSSRQNSRSSSISRPPRRWVSLFRITCSCSPMR